MSLTAPERQFLELLNVGTAPCKCGAPITFEADRDHSQHVFVLRAKSVHAGGNVRRCDYSIDDMALGAVDDFGARAIIGTAARDVARQLRTDCPARVPAPTSLPMLSEFTNERLATPWTVSPFESFMRSSIAAASQDSLDVAAYAEAMQRFNVTSDGTTRLGTVESVGPHGQVTVRLGAPVEPAPLPPRTKQVSTKPAVRHAFGAPAPRKITA